MYSVNIIISPRLSSHDSEDDYIFKVTTTTVFLKTTFTWTTMQDKQLMLKPFNTCTMSSIYLSIHMGTVCNVVLSLLGNFVLSWQLFDNKHDFIRAFSINIFIPPMNFLGKSVRK